ncbi:MAG TPA: glycosyltransferase family A protein, partial [Chloroflexota bacterium]|nr:glycosyltransferase family A protein [Chloroflexota bacterium]
PLLRRCLESLEHQSVTDWGLLVIDAGSDNGTTEFVEKVVSPRFPGRVTLLQNLQPLTPIENIDTAIRRLCSNPESVIAMVDSDDALIGTDAASIVMGVYAGGADLTVGTMLRTDKHRRYPVDFVNPRASRGGNVWQHLRTFKKSLYDRVPSDYLKLDGEWVRHTEDWAFMVPMVELSIKPVHISKSIYFYQPSPDKAERSVADRERIIAGILEKASLREAGT